ncbi:MAG: hypothetical protein KDB21_15275 [Acidimicrobiales bacterium]|nr:hypothetical protein [Acidimicrobiales bacterium]
MAMNRLRIERSAALQRSCARGSWRSYGIRHNAVVSHATMTCHLTDVTFAGTKPGAQRPKEPSQ